jgi:predicted Zn-dependent protease
MSQDLPLETQDNLPPENPSLDEHLAQLGKNSFRSAIFSLLGFLMILAAMGYSAWQLHKNETQNTDLVKENQELIKQNMLENTQLQSTRVLLIQARKQVADSAQKVTDARDEKAAIEAFHAMHWKEAIKLFDKILADDPGNVYVRDMRAYMFFKLNRISEAIDDENLAIATDPSYATSYLNLARFQCAATPARMDEARKNIEKFKSLSPDESSFPKKDGEFQRVCKNQIQ